MSKLCTTIKQSKKLIELGIDVNTADMVWQSIEDDESFDGTWEVIPKGNSLDVGYKDDVPAWSLSSLLELIPPYLGEFGEGIDFGFGKAMNGKWYSAHYLQYFQNGDVDSVKTVTGDTAVDAAFEMICYLLKERKI